MTFEQARLVRKTFQRIADIAPETVGHLFFKHLYENAPELRPFLNRTAPPEQSIKLMALLTYVISQLNNPDRIVQDATALARRYQQYGITEQNYSHIGQALLYALEQTLTDEWTPDVRASWMACYVLLAETMINAGSPSIASLRPSEPYPISYATGY